MKQEIRSDLKILGDMDVASEPPEMGSRRVEDDCPEPILRVISN